MAVELPIDDLPEGAILLRAVVVAEVLAEDGETTLCTRTTDDCPGWTAAGLALAAADKYREQVRAAWGREQRGDDED